MASALRVAVREIPVESRARGVLAGALLQRVEGGVHDGRVERRAHVGRLLVGAAVTLEADPVRRPHRRQVADGDDDPADAEPAREQAGVDGAAAAEGVDREVARVVSARDGHAPDLVLHEAVGHLLDARGALHQPQPELIAERGDGGARRVDVDVHAAAEEVARVQEPEHEVGVGHGRHRAAAPVTDRPGLGARALRPDAQRAGLRVDPGEAAAAGADGLDVDHPQEEVVLLDDDAIADGRTAAVDDADVEGRAAHVGGDDVRVALLGAGLRRRDDAADGAGLERHDRPRDHVLGVDQAAVALAEQQAVLVALGAQLVDEVRDVVAHQRADVRVEHGRAGARVLADALGELRP